MDTPTVNLTGSNETPPVAIATLPTALSVPIQIPISQLVSPGMPQVVAGSIHWDRVLKGTHKFFCDLCKSPFTKKSDLKKHKKHSCGDKKKYACSDCGKKFAYEQSMKDHENEKHTWLKTCTCL